MLMIYTYEKNEGGVRKFILIFLNLKAFCNNRKQNFYFDREKSLPVSVISWKTDISVWGSQAAECFIILSHAAQFGSSIDCICYYLPPFFSESYLAELCKAGREIAPDTGANATKFFTLATKSWKLVAKLATRMLHHILRKIKPLQTSPLSLFPIRSTYI